MLVSRNEQAVRLHHRMVGFAKCLLEIEARKEERPSKCGQERSG